MTKTTFLSQNSAASLNSIETNKVSAEELWISNKKPSHLSSETLKALIKPSLHKELSELQKTKLENLLLKHAILFQGKNGLTSLISHKIENSQTVFVKRRQSSQFEYKKAETLKNDMLKSGIIQELSNPSNFPILLVTKRDGSVRFCIDY